MPLARPCDIHLAADRYSREGIMRKLLSLCGLVVLSVSLAPQLSASATVGTEAPPKLRTKGGAFTIVSVVVSDRLFPGCTQKEFGCQIAEKGYKVLIVYLRGRGDAGKLLNEKGVYIRGSDGSRTKQFAAGLWSGKSFVAFTPPLGAHKFRLFWPGNQPISLGK
jgi:hypothetical protein